MIRKSEIRKRNWYLNYELVILSRISLIIDYGSKYIQVVFNFMPGWIMEDGNLVCKQLDIYKSEIYLFTTGWYGLKFIW